ncbi:TrkH family potassium uptake protein [Coralliovum pocilloporae]|uniref:TrkH family potassium uptake protein n=1 Tax=Coralliovum pocilloporae TaxID=3066369 RepID=UPI0033070FC2
MIDPRPITLIVGALTTGLGAAMLAPALLDILLGNPHWQVFVASSLFTMLTGSMLFLSAQGSAGQMNLRQAFIMTVAAWVSLVGFGAIPFYLSGVVPSITDAVFESMSGLTTTGATVIVGLDNAPPGILFWRGLQQWLGGLGIIVMAVAVLPMLQIGGMQLFKVEAFETPDKILPRATQISGSMTMIYLIFTTLCMIAYWAAGMRMTDALIHAMTTVATGGFSTKDGSIGHFDSAAIDMIGITFMLAGSLPFLLYVQAVQGRTSILWRDSQVKAFMLTVFALVLVAWIYEHARGFNPGIEGLRYAAFNVISIMTGTGYATTDYGAWGPFAVTFFFVIMFIGGCAGSTSCGIKIFRFQVLYQNVRQHLSRIVYPNGIFVTRFNGRKLPDSVSGAVMSFFFLYLCSVAVLAVALSFTGLDDLTAISGAATAISNVGPGLGDIIGPSGNFKPLNDTAKWLLTAGMLMGRLELFTVLVLFLPRFWRA